MKNEKDLLIQAKQCAKEFDKLFDVSQKMAVRFELLDEETLEFHEAMKEHNIVEVFDALADMLYIAGGILNASGGILPEYGIQDVSLYLTHTIKAYIRKACFQFGISDNVAIYAISDCLREVHRSNLTKLENGKPLKREDGKILKGSGYEKPKLEPILFAYNIR